MPALDLAHLTRSYSRGQLALDDVSLNVAAGEILAILGRSGSGKTTLLRLVAGLDSPNAGTVHIDGRDATRWPAHRRDVAWVPQRPTLYPHLDVEANLSAGLYLQRAGWWPWHRKNAVQKTEIDLRVREVADLLGLSPHLKRPPDALSGGEQQRVALGRALVRRAAIWLLDEPLAHLDSERRRQFLAELPLLHERYRATILYVTHEPSEALQLGHRLAVFDAGRLLQVGQPAEVWRTPMHRTTAELLADGPLNTIPGSVLGGPTDTVAVIRPTDVTLRLAESDPGLTVPITGQFVEVGTVVRVEPVSGNGFGTLTVQGGEISWRVCWPGDRPPAIGQKGDIFLWPERVHWFDGQTGRRRSEGPGERSTIKG